MFWNVTCDFQQFKFNSNYSPWHSCATQVQTHLDKIGKFANCLLLRFLDTFATLDTKALYLWLWTPDFLSRTTFESFKLVCFSNVLRWVQAYITVYLLKTYELFWSPATRPFTWAPMERMWSDYKTGGRLDAATWAIWFLPLNQNRCQFQANYSNFIFIFPAAQW